MFALAALALLAAIFFVIQGLRKRPKAWRNAGISALAWIVFIALAPSTLKTAEIEESTERAPIQPSVSVQEETVSAVPAVNISESPTCLDIEKARRQYKVELIDADLNTPYGINDLDNGQLQTYKIEMKVKNNSDLTLPYLTIYFHTYKGSKEHTGSRAPAVDVHSVAPGEAVTITHYQRGFIAGADKAEIEIEDVVSLEDRKFFDEMKECSN